MLFHNPIHTDHKIKYLKEATQEAKSTHPDLTPISLVCPISREYMVNPVITPAGFVYDKDFIMKSLSFKHEDPQSRGQLEPKDLIPFPELVPIIQEFKQKQAEFFKIKKKLIHDARDAAHRKPLIENPALFLCPLSHALIKYPVITAQGKVYDKQTLSEFLISTGNKDEKGEPLSLKNVVAFDEFFQQIKVYNLYLSQKMQSATQSSSVHTSRSSFFSRLSSLFTWIYPSKEEMKPNTDNPRFFS